MNVVPKLGMAVFGMQLLTGTMSKANLILCPSVVHGTRSVIGMQKDECANDRSDDPGARLVNDTRRGKATWRERTNSNAMQIGIVQHREK